jgi:adenosylhomocysteinase
MPVLAMLADEFAEIRPFAGRVVAACLNVTAESACLVRVLTAGGARVHLAASNPLSTQDDIAAALAGEPGVIVHARSGVSRDGYDAHLHAALDDAKPDLVLDDGGDLLNTVHAERPELLPGIRGGCEATVTGAARLRRMADAGTLAFPVFAASTSATRQIVDNRCGTGQSVVEAILRATHTLLAGKCVVVAGYGPCGSGIAERARGLGARVVVTEVDPVRALQAFMDGCRVLPMQAAAEVGDIFVTATGSREVIGAGYFEAMRDGAVLANAGQFDLEIDVDALAGMAVEARPEVRPHADEYVLAGGRRLILLAEGRVVNLVAAEGNPAEVMDVSFGVQALTLAALAAGEPAPPPGVYGVLPEIDAKVADVALAARGAETDILPFAPQQDLDRWLAD